MALNQRRAWSVWEVAGSHVAGGGEVKGRRRSGSAQRGKGGSFLLTPDPALRGTNLSPGAVQVRTPDPLFYSGSQMGACGSD